MRLLTCVSGEPGVGGREAGLAVCVPASASCRGTASTGTAFASSTTARVHQPDRCGWTEYAPGNSVYVGGQRLSVNRVLVSGGAKEDPAEHTEPYGYCDICSFMTTNTLVTSCPNCTDDDGDGARSLTRSDFIDYVAARRSAATTSPTQRPQ
jgi:hypothetical protein